MVSPLWAAGRRGLGRRMTERFMPAFARRATAGRAATGYGPTGTGSNSDDGPLSPRPGRVAPVAEHANALQQRQARGAHVVADAAVDTRVEAGLVGQFQVVALGGFQ